MYPLGPWPLKILMFALLVTHETDGWMEKASRKMTTMSLTICNQVSVASQKIEESINFFGVILCL